jgi:NAD-dependent SIR2 family protein deacetylase
MLQELVDLLRDRRLLVLTGAGCSTESGIPDYRGPTSAVRSRQPLQYREFIGSAEARQRYWARSTLGWPVLSRAEPNPAHHALAELEHRGRITTLITQNVDRLHHKAGSRAVIELHGALADVKCLSCAEREERSALQSRLLAANPGWLDRAAELAPDGDAELPAEVTASFRVVECERCGGVLKPDVVFFGENVARAIVERSYAEVDGAEALLVVGSSLTVFSGFRFVKRAAERKTPVAIVNLGSSRGDALAQVRVEARAGELMPALAAALTRPRARS